MLWMDQSRSPGPSLCPAFPCSEIPLDCGHRQSVVGSRRQFAGTSTYRQLIDVSARDGAALNKVRLRGPLEEVRPLVLSAQLEATITTLQGPISVSDYLVTRCVEAVVHGGDLEPR